MRERFLPKLACPACRGPLRLEATRRNGDDVTEGRLACEACDASYLIVRGVPRLVVGETAVRGTQESFGTQWRRRTAGAFEAETLFGLTREEEEQLFFEALDLTAADLRAKWVLDAGCGSGRLTAGLAAHGGDIVGIDVTESVDVIAAQAPAPNLHLVQGSLLDIPFADGAFDVVWSMGVIHHTGDTVRAFRNLARVVRPGGRLYVWVYSSRKLTLYKLIRDALRITPSIRKDLLFYGCYMMAPPLKAYHVGKLALRRLRGRPTTARERREARIRTIAFELFDDLAPPYQTRHTPDEVVGWFREAGYRDMIVEGEVGVRGFRAGS